MGILGAASTASNIFKLLEENGLIGQTIHFDNATYVDQNEVTHEVLYIKTDASASAYYEAMVRIDDKKDEQLSKSNLPAVTIVYLRLQQLIREFNG